MTRVERQQPSSLSATLAVLEQPGLWAVALAGFLARGGLVAFLLPIVVLPTPAGIQVELAPLLVPFVFGQPSPGLATLVAVVVVMVGAWVVVGGLVGAWSDTVVARAVAADAEAPEAVPAADLPSGGVIVEAFLARLLAHVPLALALAWTARRVVDVAYAELVTPFETTTPVLLRVVAGVPDLLLLVLVAWLLGESAGGLAAREVLLGGRGFVGSAVRGWLGLVRRPLGSAAVLVGGNLMVLVAILPGLVAAATSWSRVRALLSDGVAPEAAALSVTIFVALWLGALLLGGLASATRSALWTSLWLRSNRGRRAGRAIDARTGTIGGEGGTEPGGWPSSGVSGRV